MSKDIESELELEASLLRLDSAAPVKLCSGKLVFGSESKSARLLDATLLGSWEEVGCRLSEEELVADPTRVGELEGSGWTGTVPADGPWPSCCNSRLGLLSILNLLRLGKNVG